MEWSTSREGEGDGENSTSPARHRSVSDDELMSEVSTLHVGHPIVSLYSL